MTTKARNWENCTPGQFYEANPDINLFLWVSDGHEPYCAVILEGESIDIALRDFASDGDWPGATSLDVQWESYRNGEPDDSGSATLDVTERSRVQA